MESLDRRAQSATPGMRGTNNSAHSVEGVRLRSLHRLQPVPRGSKRQVTAMLIIIVDSVTIVTTSDASIAGCPRAIAFLWSTVSI